MLRIISTFRPTSRSIFRVLSHKQAIHRSFSITMAYQSPNLPKKLIVLCDGTWQNSDSGWEDGSLFEAGHPQIPSNVTRMTRALRPEHRKSHSPQIVYYHAGVGSKPNDLGDKLFGGGFALGLSENVREAYGFLVHNYMTTGDGNTGDPFDEIYLIGFSRGAFTARSVGGLISTFGLLTKRAMDYFYYIFEDYENAGDKSYEAKLPKRNKLPGGFHVSVSPAHRDQYLEAYKKELLRTGLTREVKIKAIGVWDTVGSLGLPVHPLLQEIGLPGTLHRYRFFDTGLSKVVENAFHALALDERRSAFSPTIWELDANEHTNLKQVWFSGVHSDVGGGYPDTGIADLTLAWMMSQLSEFLDFDDEYLMRQVDTHLGSASQVKETIVGHPQSEDWYGLSKMSDSFTGVTRLAGSAYRTPNQYPKLVYETGKPKEPEELLTPTYEFVHPSVRARRQFGGHNANDQTYDPPALKGWHVDKDKNGEWTWTLPGHKGMVMKEAPLGIFERKILERDPGMSAKMFGTSDKK